MDYLAEFYGLEGSIEFREEELKSIELQAKGIRSEIQNIGMKITTLKLIGITPRALERKKAQLEATIYRLDMMALGVIDCLI
jgi:uncharacterized protein (UPF0335 family)